MLKEIVKYIENELTGYVIGEDLFAGFVPSTIIGDYIVVIETGGRTEPSLKDYVEKTIQILAVAKDYQIARDMAYEAYDLLHSSAGIDLPVVVAGKEYRVNTISAISAPQSLGQDSKGRFIISTNYVLKAQNK
ncbi:hypothetical protein FJZ33_00155 [Candidatus Poribacteria bacterium]|nr:hypothetical protein [Candidatus Poribacteria bacterium]